MEPSLECARAGVTTGEWGSALREVFGEYRAPTGVSSSVSSGGAATGAAGQELQAVRDAVRRTGEELGGRLRLLVGKPGLDGHSNGAEQVAVRARDVGFEVVYQGIRLTPDQIVAAAVAEGRALRRTVGAVRLAHEPGAGGAGGNARGGAGRRPRSSWAASFPRLMREPLWRKVSRPSSRPRTSA